MINIKKTPDGPPTPAALAAAEIANLCLLSPNKEKRIAAIIKQHYQNFALKTTPLPPWITPSLALVMADRTLAASILMALNYYGAEIGDACEPIIEAVIAFKSRPVDDPSVISPPPARTRKGKRHL